MRVIYVNNLRYRFVLTGVVQCDTEANRNSEQRELSVRLSLRLNHCKPVDVHFSL